MGYRKIENNLRRHQWSGYPQDFLEFIYNEVIHNKPKRILEFGTGFGFVTTALGLGVLDNGVGTIDSYDSYSPNRIWKIPNNVSLVYNHLNNYGLTDIVNLHEIDDIFSWFDTPKEFDMAFIDIDNDGDKLNKVFNSDFFKNQINNGANVYFCGGSSERDKINIQRGETPITNVDCNIECVFGKTQKNCISKVIGYE